jgi:hypothetical protein
MSIGVIHGPLTAAVHASLSKRCNNASSALSPSVSQGERILAAVFGVQQFLDALAGGSLAVPIPTPCRRTGGGSTGLLPAACDLLANPMAERADECGFIDFAAALKEMKKGGDGQLGEKCASIYFGVCSIVRLRWTPKTGQVVKI